MTTGIQDIESAANYLRQIVPVTPKIAVTLGSGLGAVTELIENPIVVNYDSIPGFVQSTVKGHAGQLVFGQLGGQDVVCMNGRFHFYEGYRLEVVTLPIRVLWRIGVKRLMLTNAAGSVNLSFKAGDLMLLTDHLNLLGTNPLIGMNQDDFGPRFPDMTDVYSEALRNKAKDVASSLGIDLKEGVYAALTGPSYETPAEIRMLRTLGADAVGMSTVPEAIVARHMGIETVAISCITNMAAGIGGGELSHEEVTETADRIKDTFSRLVTDIIQSMV